MGHLLQKGFIGQIAVFFILLAIAGCQTKENHQNRNNHSEPNIYTLIKDGLYKDTLGNLWFKAVDATDPENQVEKYIGMIWSNSFINDTKELKDVIDPVTFMVLSQEYYRDKNNIYHFHAMSDGGSMRIIDGAEKESFRVFESSSFAHDDVHVYYKGLKMEGVDLASFEPIIFETEGVKIGWYAKDHFNYYNGSDIMTEDETSLLKTLLMN